MKLFPLPRSFALACASAGLMLASASAMADYVWLERAAAGPATVNLGFLDAKRTPTSALQGAQATLADGKALPLAAAGERLAVTAPPVGDLRFVAYTVTPDGALVFYQAKEGRSETKAGNDLELVPIEPNGNTFRLMWKGTVVAATQVNVSTSEGWNRVLRPAADGTVTLTTPFPGLYVLELSAKVNGSAVVDGKKYDDVRHTATLSFTVAP
ncbi:hypothetical protein GRF61_07365 [Azoarcus sp. TTM-91]|uniref:hypothetical protein n=1 Tax=Azoarcus sp. TTM-91 TaxID=2691581 RepID=UPI00145E0E3C|nr:hypothetical protein [Azoarcus sp. TTM-91]NMG34263.1 hypothetical protein [Azoarcus sp. TTM-91]